MKKIIAFTLLAAVMALPILAAKPAPGEKPGASVTAFLKWYKSNHERLAKINLVMNYNKGETVAKPYAVDFKTTEQYLTELKKSTYIGPKYVEKWREHFKKADEKFKASPQTSGPPAGFEYDLVILSQETDLNQLDKATVESETISSNAYALVAVKLADGTIVKFEMGKINEKWLIQNIIR